MARHGRSRKRGTKKNEMTMVRESTGRLCCYGIEFWPSLMHHPPLYTMPLCLSLSLFLSAHPAIIVI